MDGNINLYSSRSVHRDSNKPSVFKCDLFNVAGYVSNLDRIKNELKFITGSKNGTINVFDFGGADLSQELQINYRTELTGISSHPFETKTWATSSLDKSCLIWDRSKQPPASYILNHENQLTDVNWTSENLMIVGDEMGNFITLDPRAPNKVLQMIRVMNRGISQICSRGSNEIGVIGYGNAASILKSDGNGNFTVVYNHFAPGILYSMCWDTIEERTFYVVGEKQYAEKIKYE